MNIDMDEETDMEINGVGKDLRSDGIELIGFRQSAPATQSGKIQNETSTTVFASSGSTVIAGDVGKMQIIRTEHCMKSEKEHIKQEDIDKLKEKYKDLYQKHQIHTIDNKNRIVLTEAKVDDFAMKLKISRDIPPKGSFRDETRRYFEHLKGFAGDDIEICQLIEEDSRVTFIRGIAGMGKSVLAKQLTYGWAKGALYTDFKLCIMVECRDLNYFQATKGVDLKTHEIFEEFLKTKFNHDLKDGEGVLFVVDGMDELYDINTSDSVIRQLINRNISKYSRSKIIITGRPHVEDKLEAYDNEIGGLRKLEILGLSDEQINDYIRKFPSYHHNISFINKAKESSRGHLSVLHVPQFLNTFCCIAILMEGEKIWSPTELYCWTIYFLLKQHGDKLSSSKSRRSNKLPQIFKEYSGSLLTLSKICDELLNENKIILEGKIESMVDGTGKGKSFIESLFVDISDELHEKYQFKHLSIMEFLAALHICNTKNRIEIIKNKLDKGWIETVSFVCRLISGFSSTGIVKEMLINVTKLRSINANKFLKNVLELLCRSSLNDKVKVKRSLEIIVCFLNKSFRKKSLLTSIIAKLHHSDFESNEIDTSNIMKICNHLVDVCGCKEEEIRGAFKNIQFHWLIVDSISDLSCVKYFESVGLIELRNNRMDSIAIRRQFDRKLFGNCKLGIVDCEFKDEEYYKGERQADGKLERLRINSCKLGINSFRNLCHLGMLSEVFQLLDLNIEDQWWKDLVDMIEENHNCGDFELKELEINRCATEMTAEMKEKIAQYGVKLKIDGRFMKPHSSSTSEMPDGSSTSHHSKVLPTASATPASDERNASQMPAHRRSVFSHFLNALRAYNQDGLPSTGSCNLL